MVKGRINQQNIFTYLVTIKPAISSKMTQLYKIITYLITPSRKQESETIKAIISRREALTVLRRHDDNV